MMRYDGNGDVAWNDDIYNQGFDDGIQQGLATLAILWKDHNYPEDLEIAVQDYLEDNGFL